MPLSPRIETPTFPQSKTSGQFFLFSFFFRCLSAVFGGCCVGGISRTQAWLRRRPPTFSARGTRYCLRDCRLGRVEISLLSDWLQSRGRLPFLGVLVAGLEFRLEALSVVASDAGLRGGDEGEICKKKSIINSYYYYY